MDTLKRPSVNDDDEEILRQQAEFLKQKAENKVKLAATLVKSNQIRASTNTCTNTTQHGPEAEKMEVDMDQATENIRDQIANTFEAIPTDMKLNHITEKRGESKNIRALKFDSGGFPKALRRDPDMVPKKGSIFSQHIKRLKQDLGEEFNSGSGEQEVKGSVKTEHIRRLETAAQRSNILSSSDRETIHNQNLKTLNSMSEKEILAEREKLMSTLDPAIVQFLRSQRAATNKEEFENRNRTIKEQNEASNAVDIEQLEVPKEVLSMPEASGWLNFNKFEANKLAWMKDVVTTPDFEKPEGFEARFDFEGYLLPYSVGEIDDKNRHLYHHGDEPERPGYSLQELLLLSRSNVIQQRVTALNTLGNILGLEQTGIYDKVIDIPIEQVFFVLRVCLDDNTPSVLSASIKALRNLVYFQLDETCLDNTMSFGFGLVQPILAVDCDLEDDNTVNDQQLAESNLVKCLARTNILVRIRYTINTIKPQIETIIYCIEILIRLARDSEFIVNKMLQCEGLLSGLMNFFMPPAKAMMGSGKTPLPQAVKLIRVLSSRSRNIAVTLLKKFDLFSVVVSYLYEDYFSQNAFGMRLQVECLYYWKLLLHYGLVFETVSQHENLLLKFLDYHFKNTDNVTSTTLIRQCHASALLILLAKMVEKGCQLFPNLMRDCFAKWISQFRYMGEFKCGHSQITSAMLYYAAMCNKYGPSTIYDTQLIESVLDSGGFNLATTDVRKGSLLLNNYETHKTTANLKSLEAATWFSMDHIVPVMQTNSCIPFLYCLSSCILNDVESSPKLKTKFLNHPNIKRYTEQLKAAKYYFNVGNWFTRCESFLVMNILKMARNVQDCIDPALYYDIAVKGLCVFSAEQKRDLKFLLDNVVFCPRFYSVEVAMANTSVTERNDALNQSWKHLDDIKAVYSDVLGITSGNQVTFETTLTLDMSIGNVIPIDWIYTPLVLLYSNQQKRPEDATVDEPAEYRVILNCLRWILIYETYFESLATSISPTEKYVRLGCLFLGSDSLFLRADLQELVTLICKFLVRNEKRIDFEQEISGLTSFKDFFVQLLEQYQAVSYGNKVFGNILLFPLVKRHDVKYRKTLWSEYMGVVETFTVLREEVWLNPEDLIYPVDTDMSLCRCYFKALTSNAVSRNTILYEIAAVYVQHFRERVEKQKTNAADSTPHCSDVNMS